MSDAGEMKWVFVGFFPILLIKTWAGTRVKGCGAAASEDSEEAARVPVRLSTDCPVAPRPLKWPHCSGLQAAVPL